MNDFNLTREKVVSVYETYVDNFLKLETELNKLLLKFIEDRADRYNLVGQNVYGPVKYYELFSRVKKSQSLHEKFLRKDFGLKFLLDPEIENKENVIAKIKESLDDLIGVRIVTWVNDDKHNVYKLLQQNIEELEKLGIDLHEIDDQPQKMKNKLHIYRIKGKYKGCWFELQIKSRIENAWAEIEHSQFYKNPSYSRERNVYKEMILKCHDILEKIDSTLHLIREKSGEKQDYELSKRLEENIKKISTSIAKTLEYPVDLIPFKHWILDLDFPEELDFKIDLENSLFKSAPKYYNQKRQTDWDLIISESIFFSQNNPPEYFNDYLGNVIDYYFSSDRFRNHTSKKIEKDILLKCLGEFWDASITRKAKNKTVHAFTVIDKAHESIMQILPDISISYIDEDYEKLDLEVRDFLMDCFAIYYSSEVTGDMLENRNVLIELVSKKLENEEFLEKLDALGDQIQFGVYFQTLFKLKQEE